MKIQHACHPKRVPVLPTISLVGLLPDVFAVLQIVVPRKVCAPMKGGAGQESARNVQNAGEYKSYGCC